MNRWRMPNPIKRLKNYKMITGGQIVGLIVIVGWLCASIGRIFRAHLSMRDWGATEVVLLVFPLIILALQIQSLLMRFPKYKRLGWEVDRQGTNDSLRVHRRFGDVWICFHKDVRARAGTTHAHLDLTYAFCMIMPMPGAEAFAEKLRPLFSEFEISGEIVILRREKIDFDQVEFPKLLAAINEKLK